MNIYSDWNRFSSFFHIFGHLIGGFHPAQKNILFLTSKKKVAHWKGPSKPTTHLHPSNVPRQITSPSKSSKECTPMAQDMHDKLLGQWHVCLCLRVLGNLYMFSCFGMPLGSLRSVTCSFAGWMYQLGGLMRRACSMQLNTLILDEILRLQSLKMAWKTHEPMHCLAFP